MMYSDEINDVLSTNIFFRGTWPSNHIPKPLPKRDQGFIVNTHPCQKEGEHWIAIAILKDGTGEYFDSFGRKISVPEIQNYMNVNCSRYHISNRMIQHPISTSCGVYCVDFIQHRSRGRDMNSFVRGFSPHDLDSNESNIQTLWNTFRHKRPGRI